MGWIPQGLPGGLAAAVLALALTGGSVGNLVAVEPRTLPGPGLSGPMQPLERLPETETPVDALRLEMLPAKMTALASPPETKAEPSDVDASPLPMAEAAEERSLQLEQIAQQADRKTRYGFELAGRGAYFAARAEFIGALRLIAEGLDTEQRSDTHGRALAAALGALEEAEDFLPSGSRLEAHLDLPGLVAIHTTPVLKDATEGVTPMVAHQRYLTFAQEQFAVAAGHEVAGSMGLHAMGKLHGALAQKKGGPVIAPESKAVVFYQAALLVYPKNHMSANDLGVLLARCGHYGDARAMFEHSLSLYQQSTGWENLAVVYRQLGEAALAEQAARRGSLLRQEELARRGQSPAAAHKGVQWVDPQMFARTSRDTPNPPGAAPMPVARGAGQTSEPNRMAPAQRPATAVDWAAPMRRASSASPWPAPAPTAAERMSWGTRAYQR